MQYPVLKIQQNLLKMKKKKGGKKTSCSVQIIFIALKKNKVHFFNSNLFFNSLRISLKYLISKKNSK